jgi:hypothetical protein
VPDTKNWPVESVSDHFLYQTWAYCDSLKSLDFFRLGDSFMKVSNLYSGYNNWNSTFFLYTPNDEAIVDLPKFSDGTPITQLSTDGSGNPPYKTLPDQRYTFTGRTAITDDSSLDNNWK